jgi:putative ABC transport system permease protein
VTFAQLALANVRGSWMRYAAFFLSSTFSVVLFYLYAQFVFHPDLTGGYLYGGDTTRLVLAVCMVLIVMFAFFFVLYSSGAFLRARNQEFGLLTLMGTTRTQLRRLIWLENTFLSLASIAVGLAVGVLLSRLFLLAVARVLLLEEPMPFAIVPQAVLLTTAGFFLLFQLVTLASSFSVGRRQVIDLLRAARKPRVTPRSSALLAVVGFVLVLAGYVLALGAQDSQAVVVAFLPTVAMVVVGTYLLFSQCSLYVLKRLQRPGTGYLSGTRMLVVSQLVFRMRDNARLLATIATLSAVVLSAAGTFYIITSQLAKDTDVRYPQPLALLEPSGSELGRLRASTVDQILAGNGVTPTLRVQIEVREVDAVLDGRADRVVLVSRTAFDQLALATVPATTYDAGPAGTPDTVAASPLVPRRLTFEAGQALLSADLSDAGILAEPVTAPISQIPVLWGDWYAVSNAEFASLPDDGAEPVATLTIYDWPGSGRLASAQMQLGAQLTDAIPSGYDHLVADRNGMDTMLRQTLGLSMFAGVFVSLLFFIGAGSLIYFKLFTELPDDRRLFTRLGRIGITRGESDRVVTAQIALVFLLPFAVGGVHAFVALNALGTTLGVNVVAYSFIVVGLFAVVQLAFMALTRWTYLRALLPAR